MDNREIDLDKLKLALESITLDPEDMVIPGQIPSNALVQAYHAAAAVLTTFDPWQLRPEGYTPDNAESTASTGSTASAIAQLLQNSSMRRSPEGALCWSLNAKPRRQAFAQLRTREAMLQALERTANRPEDRMQKLFEAILHRTAPSIHEQSLQELRCTLQIIDWLKGTELVAELPSNADVLATIAWEELMEPFRDLVKDGFFGRTEELGYLQDIVDSPAQDSPLLIHGPGGVGKSTLLAEFILRNTDRKIPPHRLPLTYIDFDRADIDPREPLTFLMLAVRQFTTQYPEMESPGAAYIEDWSYRLTSAAVRAEQNIFEGSQKSYNPVEDGGYEAYSEEPQLRGQYAYREDYIYDFKTIFNSAVPGTLPWLLVLDTFEEVQLRVYDSVRNIRSFLRELCDALPQVRVIIAGRGEDDGAAFDEIELEGFDEADALAFLAKLGVPQPQVAKKVYETVTGNPLSLKLAAHIIRQEKLGDAPDSALLCELLRKVAEGNIQGQLYSRILDHISDPDVRKLAHPGLTLRYITKEIIEEVLPDRVKCPLRAQRTGSSMRSARKFPWSRLNSRICCGTDLTSGRSCLTRSTMTVPWSSTRSTKPPLLITSSATPLKISPRKFTTGFLSILTL